MKKQPRSSSALPRREFLKTAGAAAGFMVLPSYIAGQSPNTPSPSQRLNLAMVGVGGKGRSSLSMLQNENIVAFCDVDENSVQNGKKAKNGGQQFAEILARNEKRGARWFKDYRIMFEEMADQIDAVVITIPDHMHYPVARTALNLGKHVYCEKPLTHSVEEARQLRTVSEKKGLVTQMGNQGHSNEGARLAREWIQAGILGPVREVHSWTNRPIWPQGQGMPDHSKFIPVTPKGLDWDLWLGIADPRPYDSAYAPFKWRGYFDFGTGAFGDMACHILDPVYWSLDLGFPSEIEASSSPVSEVSFPQTSIVKYRFPQRGKLAPVDLNWYSGGMKPPLPAKLDGESRRFLRSQQNGSLYIGDDAILFTDTYAKSVRFLPKTKLREIRDRLPLKTIPRIKGSHQKDWLDAIRNGGNGCSNFSYSGPFTETVLLGPIAVRLQERLKLNPSEKRFTNSDAANKLLGKSYPDGWILG